MYGLSEYDNTAGEAAVLLAMAGWVGIMFLFSTVSGREYHSMRPLRGLKGRFIAFVGAQICLAIPFTFVCAAKDVNAIDLWHGAFLVRNSLSVFGWAVWVVDVIILVSPALSVFAIIGICREWRRVRRLEHSY